MVILIEKRFSFLQMIVNAFNILDQEMNSIATGIYLGVSITDHSCVPNAVATFNGTTLFIRTIQDLPSIDWSKVRFRFNDSRFQHFTHDTFVLCFSVDIHIVRGSHGAH